MLVLSRRSEETIRIKTRDAVIWIRVGSVHEKTVSLLFEAPREVEIFRGELLEKEDRRESA